MSEGAKGSVLIVGVGGLGCPAAAALAASGVRRIALADGDVVERSNLHRQSLHTEADLGENKAEVAARRLAAVSARLEVHVHRTFVAPENAEAMLSRHDVVIDATDRPESKFLLNDAAVRLGKRLVHAGVVGLEGQLLTVEPGRSACLRCLFPDPPADGDVPSCREAGILGPVAGILGSLQAIEALRLLSARPALFADRLLTVDARRLRIRTVDLRRSPACPLCGRARVRSLAIAPIEENP